MPKISNNRIEVRHEERREHFDIEINYNQDHHFYAVIPSAFDKAFDLMTEEDRKKYYAERSYKSKRAAFNSDREYKRIISAPTEAEALSRMKVLCKHLISHELRVRNVIILRYREANTNYHGERYNHEHPQVGMMLSLLYCKESSMAGGKPQYYTEREIGIDRRKVTESVSMTWENNARVIDDTPENRAFLENLYGAFVQLKKKLDEFCGSTEALLELIASNQLLLPAPEKEQIEI